MLRIRWVFLAVGLCLFCSCALIGTHREYDADGIVLETGLSYSILSKDAAKFSMHRSDKQNTKTGMSEIVEDAGAQKETTTDEVLLKILEAVVAAKSLAPTSP